MNISKIIKSFSTLFINESIEDNFFGVASIEKKFDMKRIDTNKSEDICLLCLEHVNQEIIAYKCIKCSCHLHHSCLIKYVTSYTFTNCMQCKHMHSSVFNFMNF